MDEGLTYALLIGVLLMFLGLGLGINAIAVRGGGAPAPTPTPTPSAPAITSSSISGTAEDGQTLTVNRSATGYPSPSWTYQWQVGGVDITGETAQTIVLDEAGMGLSDGDTISCEITATNTEGSDSAEPTIAYVVPAPPFNVDTVAQVGDSITNWTGGYAQIYQAEYDGLTYYDHNTGGWDLGDILIDRPNVIARDAEVVSIFIGANDALQAYSGGAAQYYADLIDYLTPIRAEGAKIVLCTPLPQGPSAGSTDFNAPALDVIALMQAGHGADFDELCDWSNSAMWDSGAEADATKYIDGVHPTDSGAPSGHQLLYPNYRGAMNRARGVARTVAQFTFTDVTGATASAVVTSNEIRVQGLAYLETAAISVTGGEYSINGGSFTSSAGTVSNGDLVEVRGTANASENGTTDVALTIGGVSDAFRITTLAAETNEMVMNSADMAPNLALAGDNLTVSQAVDWQSISLIRSTIPFTGKRYAELTINSRQGVFHPNFGVCNSTASLTARPGDGNSNGGGVGDFGDINPGGTYTAHSGTTNGDVLMLACDEPNGLIWIGKNGVWAATTNPATGTNGTSVGALADFYLFVGLSRVDNVTVNTGGSPFAYTPPSGFTAMP